MRFLWHELARAEYGEAVDYYLSHAGPVVACNFKTALNQVLSLLEEHPAIGAETSRGERRIPLHGFPFNLVYRLRADSIVIVAIANQSRRPWVLERAVMIVERAIYPIHTISVSPNFTECALSAPAM